LPRLATQGQPTPSEERACDLECDSATSCRKISGFPLNHWERGQPARREKKKKKRRPVSRLRLTIDGDGARARGQPAAVPSFFFFQHGQANTRPRRSPVWEAGRKKVRSPFANEKPCLSNSQVAGCAVAWGKNGRRDYLSADGKYSSYSQAVGRAGRRNRNCAQISPETVSDGQG